MNTLDNDPLIQDIRQKLNEEIEAIVWQLRKGKCSSFDDYRNRVGRIQGIERSLDRISESIMNYTHDEIDN